MNKRTLLFVFAITFALFGINQYFGSKRESAAIQKAKTQQAISEVDKITFEKKLVTLPMVRLFDQNDQFVANAYEIEGSFLTIAGEKTLPETLYTERSQHKLISRTGKAKEGALVFYGPTETQLLPTTYLPEIGTSSIQLISFNTDGTVSQSVGEYEGGRLFFPLGYPEFNSIVVYEVQGQFYPVGYYNAAQQDFIRVSEIPSLYEIAKYQSPSEIPVTDEIFYVLENEYQQIVFSNVGGAIAEINLSFMEKDDPESVVKPIGFDRVIKKDYTANASFPNYPYYSTNDSGEIIQQDPVKGGFYPLLRRNLRGKEGQTLFQTPAQFYAFNTISDRDDISQLVFKMTRMGKDFIEFQASQPNRRIIKTFEFAKNRDDVPYTLEMSIKVEGDSRGLYITSGVPEVELISGKPVPALKYRTTKKNKPVIDKVSLPKTSVTQSAYQVDWISNSNGFFGMIIDPLTEILPGFKANKIPGEADPTRLSLIDSQYDLYPAGKYPGYEMLLPLRQTSQTMKFRLFAGPYQKATLNAVDAAFTDPVTGYNPDYIGSQSFHGWLSFISEPFAKFLFYLIQFFHKITHSWGFSIILLTLALRIMLYPLNAWSIKSTVKMKLVQPKVKALQQKYKKDPKRLQLETMQLYRENGVNPFTGCIPLLIQMPFLIGMFDLLKSTFDLRGAVFIPGWINNLTAPDVLFSWNYPIFFFGTEFHLLPFLLGGVMFVQQRFAMGQSKEMGKPTDQQKQQQKMGMIMTVVFTIMFYSFPSGLNIYWLSSMSLAILQQWYTSKKFQVKPSNPREVIIRKK